AATAHVRGGFNGWTNANPMAAVGDDFIVHVANANVGDRYKYYFNNSIWKTDARSRWIDSGDNLNSAIIDPFAYSWTVEDFATPRIDEMVIYQVHVGTFSGRNDPLGTPPFPGGFTDMAARVGHLVDLGVNTVMLCPVTEFPFDESAGYNPITAWSPEWVYGTPDECKQLVDTLHQNGIAVLLDIVWNHFSSTDNFLWFYDGTQIYFDTPAAGTPWGDQADFDRAEVQDYFLDSAAHWLEEYKVDGFRMDATDFMNQEQGSGWSLMQRLNDLVDNRYANRVLIAEQLPDDSWVTRPTDLGGAGFDSQYHDAFTDDLRQEIFDAASGDPEMWKISSILNGSGQYLEDHWATNYVELHDEAWPTSGGQRMVVTIDTTFPHDDAFARGRTKLAQAVAMCGPGVPALLMGTEWLEDTGFGTDSGSRIDWSKKTTYAGVFAYYQDLIALRTGNSALWADAYHLTSHLNEGGNVIAFRRTDFAGEDLMVLANFSNNTYNGYRIGVPQSGNWNEVLNSQATTYGESGPDNGGALASEFLAQDTFPQSILVEVPARSLMVFRHTPGTVGVPALGPDAMLADRIEGVRPNPGRAAREVAFSLARKGRVELTVV
ncbi:alpha amylase C-terminal domain-containing protein, partial [bacterium]|nr:alpha amylase C-terminal domain-containing protein [bacterium]